MIASFLHKSSLVEIVVLNDRRTMNANLYTIVCLPEIIPELSKQSMQHLIAHLMTVKVCNKHFKLSEVRRN